MITVLKDNFLHVPALSMAFGRARNPEPAITPTTNTQVVKIFKPPCFVGMVSAP